MTAVLNKRTRVNGGDSLPLFPFENGNGAFHTGWHSVCSGEPHPQNGDCMRIFLVFVGSSLFRFLLANAGCIVKSRFECLFGSQLPPDAACSATDCNGHGTCKSMPNPFVFATKATSMRSERHLRFEAEQPDGEGFAFAANNGIRGKSRS
jgi:hypothetical protein